MEDFIPLRKKNSAVLLDTDIGPDCDDVGALAILCRYAQMYRFPILGVGHCTSNPYGAACADAVASYCGFGDLPIGTWRGEGFLTEHQKYNKEVAVRFSKRAVNGILSCEDAVDMYVRLLETAPDGGVMLISIGPLNNVSRLLNEHADLVNRKIRCLVSMAGDLVNPKEWNVEMDVPAAQNVFANWPTPIYLSGASVGASVTTGYTSKDADETNPVYVAYDRFMGGLRASYDLTAVDFAVVGEGDRYALTEPGVYDVRDDATGCFTPDPRGRVRFMRKIKSDEVIAENLNALLPR